MPPKGWAQIPVTKEAKETLTQRKREMQAKLQKRLTWDAYLLGCEFKE